MISEKNCYVLLSEAQGVSSTKKRGDGHGTSQEDSWAKAGATNKLVRLPMSLVRPWAWAPRDERKDDITKVQILSMRASQEAVSYSSPNIHVPCGPAASRARWRRQSADLEHVQVRIPKLLFLRIVLALCFVKAARPIIQC